LKYFPNCAARSAWTLLSPKEIQVIERYTINLTQLARQDKLDPVIGRDEEFAGYAGTEPPTKNNPV